MTHKTTIIEAVLNGKTLVRDDGQKFRKPEDFAAFVHRSFTVSREMASDLSLVWSSEAGEHDVTFLAKCFEQVKTLAEFYVDTTMNGGEAWSVVD